MAPGMASGTITHRSYRRLDVLLARGAVVAVDGVFGDHRFNRFGDVFDGACAFSLTALQ